MGQLSTSKAIFLSAGVPDPNAEHFVAEGDSAAIASAITSLLYVVLGRRRLVWGGHPAITPIVWAYCESTDVDYKEWVTLYQSRFFEDEFPEETRKFENVVFTEAKLGDRLRSLAHMRDRMIAETDFESAVFIGGMRGILDEFQAFRLKAPIARILPIVSSGGATSLIASEIEAPREFYDDLDYVGLFHRRLIIDPNERRYHSPKQQPEKIAERLLRPSLPT